VAEIAIRLSDRCPRATYMSVPYTAARFMPALTEPDRFFVIHNSLHPARCNSVSLLDLVRSTVARGEMDACQGHPAELPFVTITFNFNKLGNLRIHRAQT
jgi:hypothetical protein